MRPMRFSTFVFKNLLRRPARTTLTAIGIASAVSASVGGAYPAVRGAQLLPTEALRHE